MNDDGWMNEERLQAMLREDLGSEDEAEMMLASAQRLPEWNAPQPDSAMRARLLERLAAEMQTQPQTRLDRLRNCWPLLLLRSQAQVVRGEIWLASGLMIALGTLVTLASGQGSAPQNLPLVILAPVVSVFAVALLYDNRAIQMLELESTTAVSARMLLLARLTLVFGFNLLLMLAGSVVLSLTREDLSLWPLVMSWFAPMSFLSALAFLMSVLLMDALAASLIGLLLWMAHVLIRARAVAIDLPYWLSCAGLERSGESSAAAAGRAGADGGGAVAGWSNERYGGGAL